VIGINLKRRVLGCKWAGKQMMQQKTGGVIVNIASIAGVYGSTMMSHYGAAKSAVIMLTRELGVAWGRKGIRVNCIAPGPVETEGYLDVLKQAGPDGKKTYETVAARVGMGRWVSGSAPPWFQAKPGSRRHWERLKEQTSGKSNQDCRHHEGRSSQRIGRDHVQKFQLHRVGEEMSQGIDVSGSGIDGGQRRSVTLELARNSCIAGGLSANVERGRHIKVNVERCLYEIQGRICLAEERFDVGQYFTDRIWSDEPGV